MRYIVCTRKKSLKYPEQITRLAYLHIVVFRMHERDTDTEKELDTVLQMTLEYALTQRFKPSTKWTAKVKNVRKYTLFYKEPLLES